MSDPYKIAICIPTAGSVKMSFAYSLVGLVAYTAGNGTKTIQERPVSVCIRVMESSNWITNREKLARNVVDEGHTHLMFLDDDMVFEPQVLEVLLGRRQQIVVTNYLIKTEPASNAEFVGVGLDGNRVPTKESSAGIQPVFYSGFGVSLIETEVFKKTPQPWFLPDFINGEYTTEDNPRAAGICLHQGNGVVQLDHQQGKAGSQCC